jgi:diguanylate cyclase (GGDEF)-like protein
MAQMQRGGSELLSAALGDDPGVVGCLDIDDLAGVNERDGRAAGDRMLDVVRSGLEAWARAAGVKAATRIAGDEFGFVVPGRTLEEGFLLAEDLRRRLADGPDGVHVTIGVASRPRDAAAWDDLWHQAEVACWLAKDQGGNRVGLPGRDDMVMKSCFYPRAAVSRLRALAARLGRKESELFREALVRLLDYYDSRVPETAGDQAPSRS